MADSSQFSSICHICYQEQISKQSTIWCSECEQALCDECKRYHGFSKSSRNHVVIPIADYLAIAPSISSGYCIDHEEKYQMLCQSHDTLLCVECIEKHSECKDVVSLNKMIKKFKTSEAFTKNETDIIAIDTNISKIEKIAKEKQISVKDQIGAVLCEVKAIRKKINEHLDQIEHVVRVEGSDFKDKVKNDIETMLKNLAERKQKQLFAKRLLNDLKKQASSLQTYFGLRQISSEISSIDAYLQSIVQTGILDTITVKFCAEENAKNIPKNILTFGSLSIEKSPCNLVLNTQKEKETQSKSINVIRAKLVQTIDIKGINIRGCDFMPDGRMVFSDYHSSKECLTIIDSKGKQLFEISLKPCHAVDVACIDEKTVAVTSDKSLYSGVNIIDISIRTILKFIARSNRCYGITTVKKSLLYCVEGKGIERMDLNGENPTLIVRCNLPKCSYIAAYEDKLYYTDENENTVICCDMKGNTIWTFNDATVLPRPYGISVDEDERVYVVNNEYSSVLVLSADRQQNRQLISKENGLNDPTVLQYNSRLKKLLIANRQTNAFMYEIL